MSPLHCFKYLSLFKYVMTFNYIVHIILLNTFHDYFDSEKHIYIHFLICWLDTHPLKELHGIYRTGEYTFQWMNSYIRAEKLSRNWPLQYTENLPSWNSKTYLPKDTKLLMLPWCFFSYRHNESFWIAVLKTFQQMQNAL